MTGTVKYKDNKGNISPASGMQIDLYLKKTNTDGTHTHKYQYVTDENGKFKLPNDFSLNTYIIFINSKHDQNNQNGFHHRGTSGLSYFDEDNHTWYLDLEKVKAWDTEENEFYKEVQTKKYNPSSTPLSGVNATVILNDGVSLDIASIQFSMSSSKMPLYGYKSVYFNDVARGVLIAQGDFMMNMKQAAQMSKHLNHISNRVKDQIPSKEFSLKLEYKDSYADTWGTGYKFTRVQITNVQESITPSGEPIGEVYSFIAHNVENLNPDA